MRGIGYNLEQDKVVIELDKVSIFKSNHQKEGSFCEPIYVLDVTRNPNSFTCASFDVGAGGGVVISENTLDQEWPKDEWAGELQPILGSCQRFVLEDWESSLSGESVAQDQSLLRWISGDVDDNTVSLKQLLQAGNDDQNNGYAVAVEPWGKVITNLNKNDNNVNAKVSMDSCVLAQQHQLNRLQSFEPQFKRHNPGIIKVPFVDNGSCEFLPSNNLQPQLGLCGQLKLFPPQHQFLQKPAFVPEQEVRDSDRGRMVSPLQQQEVIYDQLYKVAEFIVAGNFLHAQVMLARLNHQLSLNTKPFQRACFHFKEALQMAIMMSDPKSPLTPRIPSLVDGMFKMGGYKLISEVSPLIQFMNFTSNQAILEALDDADSIHILDFDIGFGVQWSSFLQELPRKDKGAPFLKITAFVSPTTHHPTELGLMHENLTQFADEIGVPFELEVLNLDSFDPNTYPMSSRSSENEAVAVNFPIWSLSRHMTSLPSILCFIKQLSPKIMVSMGSGCERIDLPFPQHLLHAIQYYDILLDSIDASNATSEAVNKIERFLFQPRIESMILGRLHFPDQMLPWKSVFASLGFSSTAFSNIAETQADCVAKRTSVSGFHVEKRLASLVLCWQHHELISASAWRC